MNSLEVEYNLSSSGEVTIMSVPDVRAPVTRFEVGEWPDLTNRDKRTAMTPAAVKAMARLAERWGLTVTQVGQLLGGVSASSWHSWQQHTPRSALSTDQLTRVSLLLGTYTALHVLHPGALADEWVKRPNSNPIFGGSTPLDVMLAGGIPAMLQVRALLDGRRGGL